MMFDICTSLKDQADTIFIMSFHANEKYIQKLIDTYAFDGVKIVFLEIFDDEDDALIEQHILKGPFDDHAGNSELSNMLAIHKHLVTIPDKNTPKSIVWEPFGSDNLIEKCPTGIADNHPEWIVDKIVGQEILDIYVERVLKNLSKHL